MEIFHQTVSALPFQRLPPEVFYKKGVLKNFAKLTGKHLYGRLFFNKVAGLLYPLSTPGKFGFLEFSEGIKDLQLYKKRGSGTGVFLGILQNFKNNFFTEHLWTTASAFHSSICANLKLFSV